MLKTELLIEGETISVEISSHAIDQMAKRDVDSYGVFGLLLQMGERLLDMKNGEEFALMTYDNEYGIMCSMNVDFPEIRIDVITVYGLNETYVTRGTKVYKMQEVLSSYFNGKK